MISTALSFKSLLEKFNSPLCDGDQLHKCLLTSGTFLTSSFSTVQEFLDRIYFRYILITDDKINKLRKTRMDSVMLTKYDSSSFRFKLLIQYKDNI